MQLTREQVSQLSEHELEAYAKVVIDESRRRRGKLDRARQYRGRHIIPALIPFVAIVAIWTHPRIGWDAFIVFLVTAGLMQWHAAGLNRRLDSLMDLLALEALLDGEKPMAIQQSKSQITSNPGAGASDDDKP